ncbi:glycoside hydrolase family 88 protein [Hydnum rufescens UP504]|uniref:Glycoside hydrolase family 88 protein n=1 Tax=Hydnum rufescens UP504 TaxID=1448309 RepID=A0A9P6E1A6_9AGAM|nr:glycoside hydrolase family 88 protein [Hydnum rufescens UP504]
MFSWIVALTLLVSASVVLGLPENLYSPLISSKLAATSATYLGKYPQYTDHASPAQWIWFNPDGWTSGFLPATLYELHTRQSLCPEQSDGIDWLSRARNWSAGLVPLETANHVGHDVGFLSFPFVEELKLNPTNAGAIQAVNAFANDLARRFNPVVGCTRSWDSPDPDFEVIIDNMMNLDVLFVSSQLTGNTTLHDIAVSHADKTRINHFRPDNSTYHVVHYNSVTGAVTSRVTAQGYANNSTWTRGQSWAIYGYANIYHRTGFQRYLDTARGAANLYLSRLPASQFLRWDFDAPAPAPADTSSATIASNGLLLLSQLERSLGMKERLQNNSLCLPSRDLHDFADYGTQILQGTANLAWSPTWQSLLSNGTVNKPAGNYLTGIVYGDYYWIKAGNELIRQGYVACPQLKKP